MIGRHSSNARKIVPSFVCACVSGWWWWWLGVGGSFVKTVMKSISYLLPYVYIYMESGKHITVKFKGNRQTITAYFFLLRFIPVPKQY